MLRAHLTTTGYEQVSLWDGRGGRRRAPVHQLVVEAFIGPRGNLEVNHIDGDKRNNRVANLELVTRRENALHASAMGLLPKENPAIRGEANPAAELSEPDVVEIRRRHREGESQAGLGRHFGVHSSTIHLIVHRKKWRHVA